MILTEDIRLKRTLDSTWRLGLSVLLTSSLAWLAEELWFQAHFAFPALLPSVLGTALAFFIAFNSNQAYGRWWEGRMVWGGLVNESRTWARQCLHLIGPEVSTAEVNRLVRRQLGFVLALKAHLRGERDDAALLYLPEAERAVVAASGHHANTILNLQQREVGDLCEAGRLCVHRLQRLDDTLSKLCTEMGRAERIKNTVYPPTYFYYAKLFTHLLVASTTILIGEAIGPWAIAFGFVVGYVFLTVHEMGKGLVNPFERSPMALPIDQIARSIEITLLEMLGEEHRPAPEGAVGGEYLL